MIVFIAFYLCAELFTLNNGKGDRNSFRYLKGNDYVYFYNGAKLIQSGSIYNNDEFRYHLRTDYDTVAQQRTFRPLHPPILFYLYIPLTWLSYLASVNAGTVIFYLIYLLTIFLITLTDPVLKNNSVFFFFAGISFPPLNQAIQTGHPASLWILFLTAAYYFWKQGRPFVSGLFLSLLLIKPNYFLFAGAIFLFALDFKVISGLLCGGMLLVFVTGIWNGFTLWKEWIPVFMSYRDFLQGDNIFERQHSTETFFQLLYNRGITGKILSAAGLIIGCLALALPGLYKFRSKLHFSAGRFWFTIPIVMVLANPHMFDYDLVILLLPLGIAIQKLYKSGVNTLQQIAGIGAVTVSCFAVKDQPPYPFSADCPVLLVAGYTGLFLPGSFS